MSTLSVIILARNEEDNIADAIRSASFADEILVIDDQSTDKTASLAEAGGARVISHPLNNDWGAQRNFAISQASSDYLFFLDADERVSEGLAKELAEALQQAPRRAFAVNRDNYISEGRISHGILRPDWVTRIVPRDAAQYDGRVHEKLVCDLPLSKLKGKLIHYPYRNWDQYWKKFDRYTTLSAQKYAEAGKKCSVFRDLVVRPVWAFIKIYLLNLGFLDGRFGWIFSCYHFSYTLTKYVKLYALTRHEGRI